MCAVFGYLDVKIMKIQQSTARAPANRQYDREKRKVKKRKKEKKTESWKNMQREMKNTCKEEINQLAAWWCAM